MWYFCFFQHWLLRIRRYCIVKGKNNKKICEILILNGPFSIFSLLMDHRRRARLRRDCRHGRLECHENPQTHSINPHYKIHSSLTSPQITQTQKTFLSSRRIFHGQYFKRNLRNFAFTSYSDVHRPLRSMSVSFDGRDVRRRLTLDMSATPRLTRRLVVRPIYRKYILGFYYNDNCWVWRYFPHYVLRINL